MSVEQLAKAIAQSLARNQSRGLVDDARGMSEVVIHGRIDLLGVAEEMRQAYRPELKPVRQSWGSWFVYRTEARRRADKGAWELQKLVESLKDTNNEAEAALIRLRCRDIARA